MFLKQNNDKYTNPQMQNKLINVMRLYILRNIATIIQKAKFLTYIADEVTDASKNEQLVVCFLSVHEDLEPNKNVLGIHHVDSIMVDVLVATVNNTMQ